MNDGYRSRKFTLAACASLVSHVALLTSIIEGGVWVAAQTLILGLYSAANVVEKRQDNGTR